MADRTAVRMPFTPREPPEEPQAMEERWHPTDWQILESLQGLISERRVTCKQHPTLPLKIWNYSKRTHTLRDDDPLVDSTRALVTDADVTRIVARSFPRILHPNEVGEGCEIASCKEKIDGSLVILFWHGGSMVVASRGSFDCPQAKRAREILTRGCNTSDLDHGLAYSLEIVYPDNRMVVDYGDLLALFFLGAFRPDGAEEEIQPSRALIAGFRLPESVSVARGDTLADLAARDVPEREGYVVRLADGRRAKVKFPGYLRAQSFALNLTVRGVWTWFRDEISIESIAEGIPDEFVEWVRQQYARLETAYRVIEERVESEFKRMGGCSLTRSHFARQVRRHRDYRALLLLYDEEDVWDHIVQAIKPTEDANVGPCGGINPPRDPSPGQQRCYLFDLDRTLFLERGGGAVAVPEVVDILRALRDVGHKIVLYTGRESSQRRNTEDQLAGSGIVGHELYMRSAGDRRGAVTVKMDLVARIARRYAIAAAFEDDPEVAGALSDRGIRVLLVSL